MKEAVIIDAIRTPTGKRNGSLSGIHAADLLGTVIKELVERSNVDPELVEDVIAGCVTQAGEQSNNVARTAVLAAGLPESVPATTIDRQCGSSLQALQFAAQGVMAGGYDLVIACGVEVMSRVPIGSAAIEGHGQAQGLVERYEQAKGHGLNQFGGAEMIAREIGLKREQLDELSLESHMRADKAKKEGRFKSEIIPIQIVDSEGNTSEFIEDETIRADTTLEKIASLDPVFPGMEVVTAGNSSQISDGASAVLVASRETAEKLGLKPRAKFVSFAIVGEDPITMLKGPIPATKMVLEKAGLTIDDMDLIEVNEAFASVVLRWQDEIQSPFEKVNVNGGAIALGHPLGSTGTRIIATLLNELERRDERYGLVAICEGGGLANAMIIERIE